MTGRSGVSQPRPGRRASFPDNLPDPGPAAAIAIAARRFEITLAGRPATMDLTRLPGRASLARSFTQALWQACQVGGPAGTVRTAMSLAEAIHRFWRYLDATGSPVQALAGLDVSTIEGFDTWMAESGLHPNNRLHLMGDVVSLLRLADAGEPGGLSEESSRRLLYVSTRRRRSHRAEISADACAGVRDTHRPVGEGRLRGDRPCRFHYRQERPFSSTLRGTELCGDFE